MRCVAERSFAVPGCFLTAIAGFLLGGCGAAHYEYPAYAPLARPTGATLPLRVAVAYPDEGRSPPTRDEDLEPIWTANCTQTPTWISPRLEISRCLLDELRASRAFATVHWAPERLADYDLVVRLKILSAGEVGFSSNCPTVLGPSEWELVVADHTGRELGRARATLARLNIYAIALVATHRKKQQAFLGELVPVVLAAAGRVARDPGTSPEARLLAAFDRLDPELKDLRARLAATGMSPEDRDQLERGYLMRIALLESLRRVEEQRAEALQQQKDQAWLDVQEQTRRELKQLGEQVSAMTQEALGLLVEGVAGAARPGRLAGRARTPAALQRANAAARQELLRLVDAPDGVDQLLAPAALRGRGRQAGGSGGPLADAAFRRELTRRLRALGDVENPSADPAGPWLQRYRRLVAGEEPRGAATAPAAAGCAKDTDCKGDRICVKRECVDPPPRGR
jgi:hypothetical protein